MRTFAFLYNPANLEQLNNLWPISRLMPGSLGRKFLKNSQFKKIKLNSVRSNQGIEVEGFLLCMPLLPAQISELQHPVILEKTIAAAQSAKKLGAQILGLGGTLSLMIDSEKALLKRPGLPITAGYAFTAWSMVEAIFRMARAKNIDLKEASLAVIGADNPVGALCARKFSETIPSITICGKDKAKLENVKQVIISVNPIQVNIKESCDDNAAVIINANTSEISVQGVVVRVGLIKLPENNLGVNLGLPEGIVPAAMAEAMLLALEERFVNYSFGDIINPDKLEEIADIAVRHGFEVWVPEAPIV